MEVDKRGFVCPYERKGIEDGTIIVRELSEDRKERLLQIRSGFDEFNAALESPGLKLILPPSMQGKCASPEALKREALFYQAETIAVDLDIRLYPFLPYQINTLHSTERKGVVDLVHAHLLLASCSTALIKAMQELQFATPHSVGDLGMFIHRKLADISLFADKRPGMSIEDEYPLDEGTRRCVLLDIKDSGCTIPLENTILGVNNSKFNLLQGPCYPKNFPRFSPQVQIIVTRWKDIFAVPVEQRRKIRYRVNKFLRGERVKVEDLIFDQPDLGVWIPKYK